MRAVRHEGEVAKVKVGQQHTYNCSSKVALKRLRFIGAYDTTGVHDSAVECFIRSCHNYMFRSFSCPPRRLLMTACHQPPPLPDRIVPWTGAPSYGPRLIFGSVPHKFQN